MKPRALFLALVASGSVMPEGARADVGNLKPEDNCAVMFVYAVNQVCSLLSNGLTQCQPVGVVGPAPSCKQGGLQPLMQVPLSAPVVQAPTPRTYAGPPAYAFPYGWPPAWPGAVPAWPPAFGVAPVAPPPRVMPAPLAPTQVAVAPPAAPTLATAAPAPAPVAPTPANPASAQAVPPPTPASAETPPLEPAPPPTSEPAPANVAVVPAAPPAQAVPTPPQTTAAPSTEASPTPSQRELEDALAHFEFDSAKLTDKGRAILDDWLGRHPRETPVRVTGHADRLGPEPYNLELSRKRAETVRQYLMDKGVADRHITLVAKGEAEPVKNCRGGPTPTTKDCLAPNRRVVVDPE